VIPAYLTALPFIFGFGSSNGAYDQAANAAGLTLIAAVAVLSVANLSTHPLRMALVISVATLVFVTVTVYESRQAPYRNPPIAQHDVPVEIGDEGHTLLLDSDLASVLTELESRARVAGWVSGTPIVGLQWRWSTTIPYFLGGQVPDSLMLTIFGYPGTVDRAAYNLENAREFPLEQAWIIATTSDFLGALGIEQTDAVADELLEAGANPFPDGYVCVAEVASFQLWRPASTVASGRPEGCPKSDINSHYDASSGWRPPSGN
jgi:hypothetical protein